MSALSNFKTTGMHRVRFFHECGLVPVMPTREQVYVGLIVPKRIHRAIWHKIYRTRKFWRQQDLLKPIVRDGDGLYLEDDIEDQQTRGTLQTPVDRSGFENLTTLGRLLSVPLYRGLLLAVLCPEYTLSGYGFTCGRNLIINHLLYLPHIGIGPVWDFQLLQADPNGLELLEERLEIARTKQGVRGRLYHEVAQSGGDVDGWYESLDRVIPRIRAFDYPDMGSEPTFVHMLNRCAQLQPEDMAFFRRNPAKTVLGRHPEIGWPHEPTPDAPLATPRSGPAPLPSTS